MARNVNVWIQNWRWTGNNVPTPQAAVDITIKWTDDVGVAHEHSETARFPNCLQDVPVAWVREQMEDLILRAVQKKIEID